jgi:AraC-like DNA-binding protein
MPQENFFNLFICGSIASRLAICNGCKMTKILKKFINKFNNLTFFVTIFIILIIFIVTITFSILSKQEQKRKIEEYINISRNSIEERIEKDIVGYLDTHLLKYSRTSVYSIFYEQPKNDLEFLNSIRISIIDSIRTKKEISDLILYRVDDNAVVSARKSGYTMESLAANFDDIKSIVSMGQVNQPRLYATADKKITYIFPIFHQNRWREDPYRGFATLYLSNPNSFFNTAVDEFNSKGTFVMISGESVLYAEGNNILSDDVLFEMVNHSSSNQIKYANPLDYTYYYIQAPTNDMKYLYYEPTANFFQNLINYNYLFFYLLTLFLILIFSAFIYYFIKKLHSNYEKQQLAATEYANQLMKTNQPGSLDLIIDKYLKLESLYPNYAVIIVEPDATYLNGLSEKQKNFIPEEFKEIGKNLFKSLELPNIVSSQLKGYVSCIINYNDDCDIRILVHSLGEEFKKYNKCPFNIFYSGMNTNTTDATKNYTRILELIKYSFIFNYNHIFNLAELEEMETNSKVIEPKVTETVQGYLTEFNPDNFIYYLRTKLDQIRENQYSYVQTIDYFNMVLLAIKNFFNEKSVDYKLKNIPLAEQLHQFRSLEECIAYIETTMNQYKETLLSNYTPTNRRYMENILQFIDDNIEVVSLASVAEEFHITAAHLSRIFKENVGVNFSEHVSEKKLLQAAKLLRDNQKLNITELANKLGYNTPSYFSTKFKERFGVTPGVYKKEYINSKS